MDVETETGLQDYFRESEYVVDSTSLGAREIVVTDKRLIITDDDGRGTPTLDVHHANIDQIRVEKNASPKWLYWAGGTASTGTLLAALGYTIEILNLSEQVRSVAVEAAGASTKSAAEMAGTVVAVKWLLIGLGILGLLIAGGLIVRHLRVRRALLVVDRVERTSFDIKAPEKAEAQRVERELEQIYDQL